MEYVRPLLPGLFALVFATSLSAQEVSGPALDPDRGPSIALGAGAGTTVGLWTAVGERTDVGLALQASLTRLTQGEAAERSRSAGVGLLFKRFLDGDGDVAPYVVAGPFFSYARSRLPLPTSLEAREWNAGGRVGVGLDWFPTARVSLGGHVGMEAAYARRTRVRPDPFTLQPEEVRTTGFSVRTLTSGIRVHLYLR